MSCLSKSYVIVRSLNLHRPLTPCDLLHLVQPRLFRSTTCYCLLLLPLAVTSILAAVLAPAAVLPPVASSSFCWCSHSRSLLLLPLSLFAIAPALALCCCSCSCSLLLLLLLLFALAPALALCYCPRSHSLLLLPLLLLLSTLTTVRMFAWPNHASARLRGPLTCPQIHPSVFNVRAPHRHACTAGPCPYVGVRASTCTCRMVCDADVHEVRGCMARVQGIEGHEGGGCAHAHTNTQDVRWRVRPRWI